MSRACICPILLEFPKIIYLLEISPDPLNGIIKLVSHLRYYEYGRWGSLARSGRGLREDGFLYTKIVIRVILFIFSGGFVLADGFFLIFIFEWEGIFARRAPS